MESIYTLTPGGAVLQAQLGFQARSVVVDNLTSQFLLVGASGQRVAPYTPGFIVRLPAGTQQAGAQFATPDGVMAPPANGAERATLRYLDLELPPSPTVGFQPGTPQQLLATFTGAGAPLATKFITVPSGTHGIAVVSSDTIPTFSLVGHQSSQLYLQLALASSPLGFAIAPFFSALDTQVELHCTGNFTLGQTVWIIAVYDTLATIAYGSGDVVNAVSRILPGSPLAGNILAGNNNVNAGTLITIPAGRTWYGSVTVEATGSAAGNGFCNAQTAGAGASPPAATILCGCLTGNATTANASNSATAYVAAPAGNAVTISVNFGTVTTAQGTAAGILL